MRLSKPIKGKKSVTLWFEQEKDQGYRLTTVDATNLLDAKEKASSEKEITTEKEKKGTEFAQLIQQLGNPQTLGLGGNARWRNGLSRNLPATRATRSGDGIQEKKPRNWCWYKKGDIIGRSTDRHQGSFLSPGWEPLDFRS